jgi:hypothetical protein
LVLGGIALSCVPAGAQTTRSDASGLPGTENVNAFIASRVQRNWMPPRTPWGDPDIQGVFTTRDEANTPFERPDEWAGRKMDDITPKEFAEAVVKRQQEAVERAPFAGGGEAEQGVAIAVPIHWFDNLAAKNSRDSYIDRTLDDRCIIGLGSMWPTPTIYGNSYQIVQSKDYVILRCEMVHEARMIPLDGRPQPSGVITQYPGTSRARWDGNTPVVETSNFDSKMEYRNSSTNDLRLIERPWTYSIPLTEDSTQLIHEYACHEGNFGMANLLTGGRLADEGRAPR